MRCPHCGFNSFESAKFCAECGMPFEVNHKDPARYAKERKVVKLPSDTSDRVSKPIERPWEVTVPQRESHDAPAAASSQQNASASSKDDKGPTPRRHSGSIGSGNRVASIKHPTHESGKIPASERHPRGTGATRERKPSPGDTAPILIVDESVSESDGAYEARASVAAATFATPSNSSRARQARRNAQRESYSAQSRSSNKSKPLLITIAILIVICFVALGIVLFNTSSEQRTVSFDTDGGTIVGNQYIDNDGQLDRPANPTRPGYEFEGWYLDSSYDEKASFPITVTQDMTLYGKWTKETTPSGVSAPGTTTTPGQSVDGSTDAAANGGNAPSASGNASGSAGSGSSSSGKPNAAKPSTGNSSKPSTGGSGSGSSGSNAGAPAAPAAPSNLNGPGVTNGKVEIRLTAANGSTLSGTVTLKDGYVIPDSSTKAYTIDELKALGLNDAELCIARNEPYARMGYSFRNPGLQAYFNARSWYKNTGWRGELPTNSAGYITAHNLLTIAQQSPSASKWLKLKMK